MLISEYITPVMYTDYSGMAPEFVNRILRGLFINPLIEKLIDFTLKSFVKNTNSDELVAMLGITISAGGGILTKNMGVSFSLQRVCNATDCEYQYVFGTGFHSSAHLDGGIYTGIAGVKSFDEMYGPGITGGASYAKGQYGGMFEMDYYPDSKAGLPLGINVGYSMGYTVGENVKIEVTYTRRIGGIFND